ncbi:MAG: DUF421 domain-containing protein [Clostridiales bacterium]|uniref:DUF421 domain-containing protein n=1 Tax=Clostridium sp. N3C TaxID=1776758 RepID=UPI00092DFA49|nr:DUF421 domain-containing protein [Clostridium sp. N3C]NLZ48789.1 DUF421 domain-containing protein [Clostridiales bacterium]SCN22040.1 hypothetical protein N3C_0558 [Clostridium sp. N3C]
MENWIIVLIRTIAMFALTILLIRLLGRGSLSKITPYKFVNYTIIALMITLITLGFVPNITHSIIALAAWFALFFSLDFLSLKSKALHDAINGRETIIMKDGKVMEENLKEVRLTGEELLRELRSKNIFNLADVEFAVMESTGEINVMLKSDKKPITAHDLQRKVAPKSEPQTVILDGNILDESLANRGLNRAWLKVELAKAGVSLDNVFIGQVDSSGDLYLDLFDDSVQVPQPKVKELLYANLQQCHADLLSYALETEDKNAKEMYTKNADKLKVLINKLEPYLLS